MNNKYVLISKHGCDICNNHHEALALQASYKVINIETVIVKPKAIVGGNA